MADTHKKHLLKLIELGKLGEAIRELLEATEQNGQKGLHSNFIGISGNYHRNENANNSRTLSESRYTLEWNRIKAGVQHFLEEYRENGQYQFVPIENKPVVPPPPLTKPTFLMCFAQNDLGGVEEEARKIRDFAEKNSAFDSVFLENADIDDLADAIIDANHLMFFHFGGHADTNGVVLDGFRTLDKNRLSRLLLPSDDHQLQFVFLNGCLSHGHIGVLTAKGVKAILATNKEINDGEAARFGRLFYKLFFEKNSTLRKAYETADATVSGHLGNPVIVNPGEDLAAYPSSWTLYVHSAHTEVLDWTLAQFIRGGS